MNFILNTRIKCSECPIRHRAVCSRCDEDELAELEAIKNYRTFAPGDTILWRGDELQYVGSVVKGVATLGKTLEDGRTQMVGLLLPSDFIGRPGRSQVDFDITAVNEVTLCCFDRAPFEKMLHSVPHLSQRLIEIAMDELDAAREWMLLLGRKTAREKMATFIEMLASRQQIEGLSELPTDLALPLTRDEIANFLGLTLETVSRQLSQLKKEGVLEFSGRRQFTVLDYAALHDATGDDSDGGPII